MPKPSDLYQIRSDGRGVDLFHHKGQWRAWNSERRFVAILAGAQSGKTSWLPWWLAREIRRKGEGDYLAVTANYDLFQLKFLPALRDVFEDRLKIGRWWASSRIIEIADPATGAFQARRADDPMWARIILRSAESGGGLESATAKAAILDEAGQDAFTLETWEAIRRRLVLHRGRACIGTTIYNFGWLKAEIYDRWAKGDPDIEVVQFDSTENPRFPQEEFDRARETMPLWRFNMFYRGRFERPAGLIYDSFDEKDVIPRFSIPDQWPRLLGLDFGGVNTAGMFYAREPGTKQLFAYRQYKAGGRTAGEHARHLIEGEPSIPTCVGGSKSEGQWRREFQLGATIDGKRWALPVMEPDIKEVELGIERVYGAHKTHRIKVFDDLDQYLAEKRSYSRVLDSAGQPTEKIVNKETYHLMDAERYIIGREVGGASVARVRNPTKNYRG